MAMQRSEMLSLDLFLRRQIAACEFQLRQALAEESATGGGG